MAEDIIASDITVKANTRNFRNSPDIENFFRFVHDNGLRKEAKLILEALCAAQAPAKRKKRKSKKIQ